MARPGETADPATGITRMGYLSVVEAAIALRTSRMTVMRLIQAGELRAVKTDDRLTSPLKVEIDSVAEYIQRHTVTGAGS